MTNKTGYLSKHGRDRWVGYDENTDTYFIKENMKELIGNACMENNPKIRNEVLNEIRELDPGFDSKMNKFVEGLRDPLKRQYSRMFLSAYGYIAIPYLEPLLNDPDKEVKKSAYQTMKIIQKMWAKP